MSIRLAVQSKSGSYVRERHELRLPSETIPDARPINHASGFVERSGYSFESYTVFHYIYKRQLSSKNSRDIRAEKRHTRFFGLRL